MNLDLTCKLETPSPSEASLVNVWLKRLESSKSAVQHGQNVIKKSITATEFPFSGRNEEDAMFLRWQSYLASRRFRSFPQQDTAYVEPQRFFLASIFFYF